jgi:hypothetical protein
MKDCVTLLESEGELLHNNTLWKPFGCNTQYYNQDQVLICYKQRLKRGLSNDIIVTGDSMARYLTKTIVEQAGMKMHVVQHNKIYEADNVMRSNYTTAIHVPQLYLNILKTTNIYSKKPVLIIFEIGRWYLHEDTWPIPNSTFAQREAELLNTLPEWGKLTTKYLRQTPRSRVVWAVQDPFGGNRCVGHVCGPELNRRFNKLNEKALQILNKFPQIWIWKSGRYIVQQHNVTSGSKLYLEDDAHINEEVRLKQVQVINNLMCNNNIIIKPKSVEVGVSDEERFCVCRM